jgi:dTDP-L-rhamnose 4-epimerase
MKVLVTGAAGFIASHVVDRLVALGHDVIGLDSLEPSVHRAIPTYLNPKADYAFVDLRHWQPDDRFDDVNAVFHAAALGGVSRAAKEPGNVIDANATGTARLVEAMRAWRGLQRVILASSFSIYGSNYTYRCAACGLLRDGQRNEADMDRGVFEVLCAQCGGVAEIQPITTAAAPNPLEVYGASKFMQELCFRGAPNTPVNLLRFSSAYGTRLRLDDGEATIVAKLAGWIRSGIRPKLLEDGKQIRDWVHVGDIVAAVEALLATNDAGPAITNVCSGVPMTLTGACSIIAETVGVAIEPEIVGGYRPGDMRHCLGDASGLAALIGRAPTAFTEGAVLAFGDVRRESACAASS